MQRQYVGIQGSTSSTPACCCVTVKGSQNEVCSSDKQMMPRLICEPKVI